MNEMAVCGCSMKVDWNYKNKNLLKTGLLLLLYVVGIYLLITKMILLEKSGSGAGKPETGRTSDVSRGKENEKALQYVASSMIKEAPKIAITFDDGPSTAWTGKLLDGLKERNVKGTFFHHVEITRVSDEKAKEEILLTNEAITEITGNEVSYMRPPFGAWQKKLEWELDVMPVMWTIDPLDWTTNNEDEIVNKVVTQAKENDIILLHDCYESSVNAALRIIDILQKEGYEFVTVDELIMN